MHCERVCERAEGGRGGSPARGLIKTNLEGVVSWCPLFRDIFFTAKCGREQDSVRSSDLSFPSPKKGGGKGLSDRL